MFKDRHFSKENLHTANKNMKYAPHPCQHLVSCLVNFSHFHWCKVVSHCGFDFYFPDIK